MTASKADGQELSERDPAFLAELAAINLQRLFWLLAVGLVSRLVLLATNHFSAARNEVLASMQWFDLIAIPPLIWLTARLRRPGASVRFGWMLIVFVVWGTLGMGVIQAMTSASDLGYRAVYVFGVMIGGVAYVLPPRFILPAFVVIHALYVTLILRGGFDARFRLASLTDGTVGVLFAAGVSWLLYRAKWNDYRKERIIAAQNRELARRNTEMQDLMSIAAHDLRSPLQGLDNVLDLAGSLVDPAAGRLRRALGEGRESCRRMLSLVTRLLDAHAAEHRREAAAAPALCDARAAFGEAVSRHDRVAQAAGVRLAMDFPATAAEVAMDAGALGQVLDNLVGNALRFAPAGTTVALALRVADGCWIGEVRDEGPGVPADEQPELFGKFRRGARNAVKAEPGFGLGLFIARQLVRSAGGELSYADGKPRGAVFHLDLPRTESAQ